MIKRSQLFSEDSDAYIHRFEFALICAKLEQQPNQIQLVQVPIASGKSFLAVLLAQIFPSSAIVVPSKYQRLQLCRLTRINPKIQTVLTMQQALQNIDKFEQFIIDDADDCILNHGTYKDLSRIDSPLRIFYHLFAKKTIMITSSKDKTFLNAMKDLGYLND